MTTRGVGRPRNFNQDDALRCAVDLFWAKGYAATSLDELLAAMQVARSSFYAAFGSKHQVLVAALKLYTEELYATMAAAAAAQAEPRRALMAVLEIAACSVRPSQGCFFVNMATELAPNDTEVHALARSYLRKVDQLVQNQLGKAGVATSQRKQRSGALLALATGAITLRKAGEPPARIREMLAAMTTLIDQ